MYKKTYHLPIKIKKISISLGFFFTYSGEINAIFYYNSINFVGLPNKKYKVNLFCSYSHVKYGTHGSRWKP